MVNGMGGSVEPVWRIPATVRALRPEAAALLDEANRLAWLVVPPRALEPLRVRQAQLIGNDDGLSRTAGGSPGRADEDADALARLTFAEQFVIDVGGMPEQYVADLTRAVGGDALRGFVQALYVTECTQRLEVMVPMLLGPGAPDADQHDVRDDAAGAGSSLVHGDPALDPTAALGCVLHDYQDAVVRGRALDPVVTELVRLRCARTHDCRICRTLRLSDAREAGADDAMTAKVDFYERSDLDERTKSALRVTDTFITRPDTLGEAAVAGARSAFTPEQLVELCLDITKWSTQKVHVALGTDGAERLPLNAQGVSFFGFADDGSVAGYSAEPLVR